MEYFTQYTRFGEPTNKTIERRDAHRTGAYHRVFHLWIINSDNQVLLQQRSATKDTGANLWYVSVGGHIAADEDIEQAILRETKEELGLDIAGMSNQLQYLFTFFEHIVERENHTDNEFYDVFVLRYDAPLNKIRLQQSEVQAVKYMDYAEFKSAVLANDPTFVAHKTAYHLLAVALDDYLG